MRASTRTVALMILALALTSCGLRQIELIIHAPATCADPAPGECPLESLRSIETSLLSVDGTELMRECMPVPAGFCDFEDLTGFLFLRRTEASDGVEVVVTGWATPGCADQLALSCDSFGDAVIDLTSADTIPMWCGCPRSPAQP